MIEINDLIYRPTPYLAYRPTPYLVYRSLHTSFIGLHTYSVIYRLTLYLMYRPMLYLVLISRPYIASMALL